MKKTIGWIAIKFGPGIHDLRMNRNNMSDPVTFHVNTKD